MNKRIKIATPVSCLFEDSISAYKIIGYSDALELRDNSAMFKYAGCKIFHTDLQPIHEISDSQFGALKDIIKKNGPFDLITLHMSSCFSDPKLQGFWFVPGGEKLDRQAMFKFAGENTEKIRVFAGPNTEIAVENNNYYPTEAYEMITDPDFISGIVNMNDLSFLLDISHAKVTAHNKNIRFDDYLNALPLNRIIQIHVSKENINDEGIAFDAHDLLGNADIDDIFKFIEGKDRLKYFTVEYYKDADILCTFLKKARRKINELS